MLNKKAQIATEYLIMVGLLLVVVGALAGYSILMYYETVSINQAKDALEDLKIAVNRMYALGEGNSIVVKIVLPKGVTETRVIGKGIYMTYTSFGSTSEQLVETDANVQGSIPTAEGVHYIEVRALDSNVSLSET